MMIVMQTILVKTEVYSSESRMHALHYTFFKMSDRFTWQLQFVIKANAISVKRFSQVHKVQR